MSVKKSTRWDDLGIVLDGKYWVGVHFTDPANLWFGTFCQIEAATAAKLGTGELSQENWVPGGHRWWRHAELSSEGGHFFSRSKVSQMEWLQDFLKESVAMAKAIESPHQPPAADQPEGD